MTLGDIADLSGLPAPLRIAATPLQLTVIPAGRDRIAYSISRSAERARALMPALSPWLEDAPGEIDVRAAPAPGGRPSHPTPCLVVKAALPAGAVAVADDFSAAACDPAPRPSAFRFDVASGTVRTARALNADERVSRVPERDLAAIVPGQPLLVTASLGHTKIARRVEAVQPAAAGRAVFVETEDGAVFSAPRPETEP